ncbi:MAG: DUF2130 domain-containing protein [Gammaproteobacteria bacterium]|nr:DUF2130 domain-containing protein [Gammaproteobacteria bacterium]
MTQQANKIECPNCGQSIDVNDLLYHQVDAELRKKYRDKISQERGKLQEQQNQIAIQKAELENAQQKSEEIIDKAVQERIKNEKQQLEKQLRAKAEEEQSERFRLLQEELNLKSDQVKELNKTKSEIEKLKREKDELKDTIEAESQKKLNEILALEREKIQKQEIDKSQLKISEKDHVIEQLNQQLKDAQRKAEQGSMQIQGEVQELAIEEWLTGNFPLDTIEEIRKGTRGGDCIHVVNTRTRQNCGSIYYESKRTKEFQPAWIEKFKNDIRDRNANIGVLVTEAIPTDMERMGQKDGIWICSFDEFKGLSVVLRESIVQLSNAILSQENKGDKMAMVYDYVTSNEFRLQIEAVVEGFTQMQSDLESEKRSLQGIWKKREKQIQKVITNTNFMYNSLKGIAGNAVQPVRQLELDNSLSDDDDS